MTKDETIMILAMLSAYYGQGKADPNQMVSAWHLILREYEYGVAEKAVIEFARTDSRDYASFPSVGQIINAIEKQKGYANLVFNSIWARQDYDTLPEGAQRLITWQRYNELKDIGYEELEQQKNIIKDEITNTQKVKLLGGAK